MSIPEKPTRVVHLSSVHARDDVRIFQKQCRSLSAAGYEVWLLVADGRGDATVDGVRILDVGAARSRLHRMLVMPWRIWRRARGLRAALYHFHDPELLPVGLLLRASGARVVYDSHEDLPRAILSKFWIRPVLRRAVAGLSEAVEDFVVRRLSAVVAATPHIAARFARQNPRAVAINNYPLLSELEAALHTRPHARSFCYIGGIGRIRGVVEMVAALDRVDARLILAGSFDNEQSEAAVRALPAWSKVDYRGQVPRSEARRIMSESCAGLVFFHPEPNHVDAQPNKIFEYMSAGLPVLASDFPLWRQLVVASGAGHCADPLDVQAIADCMRKVLDQPEAAAQMGLRGREAVQSRFHWGHEERRLLALYQELMA